MTLRRKRRVSEYLDADLSALLRDGADLPDKAALFVPYLYRNNVAHLSVIRNGDRFIGGLRRADSWFAVYHYLMQRTLEEQFTRSPELTEKQARGKTFLEDLPPALAGQLTRARLHGAYCTDLVKTLNIPFAYNLPRYKNLSVEGLFDKNRPGTPPQRGEGK